MTTSKKSVAVIGGGHNGLVAANYLLSFGYDVTIFESCEEVGGCCVSMLLPCGCILSRGATHFGMLSPRIIRDLNLGFKTSVPKLQVVSLSDKYGIVGLPSSELCTNATNLEAPTDHLQAIDHYISVQADELRERLTSGELEESLPTDLKESLEQSTADFLAKFNDSKAVLNAYTAGSGLYPHDPYDKGSAFNIIYLGMYQTEGNPGWSHISGGMGEVTRQLSERFTQLGGVLQLNSSVVRIQSDQNGLVEITSKYDSSRFSACIVTCDPAAFFSICPEAFEGARFEIRNWVAENAGTGLKINGVLSEPPVPSRKIKNFFEVSPDTAFVRQEDPSAFNALQTTQDTTSHLEPVWELTFPSLAMPKDACERHTTFSIYSNPHVYSTDVAENKSLRKKYAQQIFSSIEKFFPNFCSSLAWYETLTPRDLEIAFGVTAGNVDHGNMDPDNRLFDRGIFRGSGHLTALDNVFFGGSGSPTGGLVTGIPGYRAAKKLKAKLGSSFEPDR